MKYYLIRAGQITLSFLALFFLIFATGLICKIILKLFLLGWDLL